jgi:hypothetical protein
MPRTVSLIVLPLRFKRCPSARLGTGSAQKLNRMRGKVHRMMTVSWIAVINLDGVKADGSDDVKFLS